MKIKKNQRRKRFRFHVDRRKMKASRTKLHKTEWDLVNDSWVKKKSAKQNLEAMGLAYDPNVVVKIPTIKEIMTPQLPGTSGDVEMEEKKEMKPVAAALEAFAKLPRKKTFTIPNNDFHWIAYLVEKYNDDYKAMAKDPKNLYQETWRQIRAKIYKFIKTHKPESTET